MSATPFSHDDSLDALSARLLAEAERKLGPTGGDYAAAIKHLEENSVLRIPLPRPLVQCLAWYNAWCRELAGSQDRQRLEAVVLSATPFGDRLAAILDRNATEIRTAETLGEHYFLRGFVDPDAKSAARHYATALSWNPDDENALRMLGECGMGIVRKQLAEAIAMAEQGRFRDAGRLLDGIDAPEDELPLVQSVRIEIARRHAVALRSVTDEPLRESS